MIPEDCSETVVVRTHDYALFATEQRGFGLKLLYVLELRLCRVGVY